MLNYISGQKPQKISFHVTGHLHDRSMFPQSKLRTLQGIIYQIEESLSGSGWTPELHMATAKLLVIGVFYLFNYNGLFFA